MRGRITDEPHGFERHRQNVAAPAAANQDLSSAIARPFDQGHRRAFCSKDCGRDPRGACSDDNDHCRSIAEHASTEFRDCEKLSGTEGYVAESKLVRERLRRYFAAQPPRQRRELRKIRDVVRALAPTAVEVFAYGIPAFKLDGRPLVYYAGWKNHTSMYPLTALIRRTYAVELKEYETSKGTIRFALSQPLPVAFIRKLVKARVGEVRALGARHATS
jgi:uncharacterized protein YdhG (YjbR/CyaY superfamily)